MTLPLNSDSTPTRNVQINENVSEMLPSTSSPTKHGSLVHPVHDCRTAYIISSQSTKTKFCYMLYAVLRTSFTTCLRCTKTHRFWWGLKFIIGPTIIMTNPLKHRRSIDSKSTVLFIRAQKDRSPGNNRVAQNELGLSTPLRSWKELQTIQQSWLLLGCFHSLRGYFNLIDFSWFCIG